MSEEKPTVCPNYEYLDALSGALDDRILEKYADIPDDELGDEANNDLAKVQAVTAARVACPKFVVGISLGDSVLPDYNQQPCRLTSGEICPHQGVSDEFRREYGEVEVEPLDEDDYSL